jgi:hypothetical protein
MSDASEVLSAIYESLSLVDEGQNLVRELFEWQVTLFITLPDEANPRGTNQGALNPMIILAFPFASG